MRTKQEIAGFLSSLGITQEHVQDAGFHPSLQQYGDHRKITDFGLIVGYGDAFSYRRSGIVVVGDNEVGKSRLAKKFHEEELSDILADDTLLIFDPENNGQLEIYRNLFEDEERIQGIFTLEGIMDRYASYLANNRGVPLRVVLHLTESSQAGFVEPNMDELLGYLSASGTLHLLQKGIAPQILQGVTFLEYGKGYEGLGYKDENPLKRTFHAVRAKLDAVLS